MQVAELGSERFLLATIGAFQYALRLGDLDRVLRKPSLTEWRGGGVVQAYSMVEGLLVWVVGPAQVFEGYDKSTSRGRDWLLVLKDFDGLTRLGVLADDVRGPVAYARLGQVSVLNRQGVQSDELR